MSAGLLGVQRDSNEQCGQRRPGREHGGTGRGYLPCTLDSNHEGLHMNAFGDEWSGYLPIADAAPARGITGLRLLPWTGPDGKPAYTPDDNPTGIVAQIADDTERVHLDSATRVLKQVADLLEQSKGTRLINEPSRVLLMASADALTKVLRVAESRGMRLPTYDRDDIPEGEWVYPPTKLDADEPADG